METSFPFVAYFKLYDTHRDNLAVSFTVGQANATDLVNKTQDLIDMLSGMGYTPNPAGLDEGERIQEVDGWVLGETSTGQKCVWLYKSPLEFKVATVYQEHLHKLPFSVEGAKVWELTAPTREAAEKKGVLNTCQIKVIMVDTGKKTDKGNTVYRFDRVLGYNPPEEVKADILKSMPEGSRAKNMVLWARTKQSQDKKKARMVDVEQVIELIDQTVADGAGETLLRVLLGEKDLSAASHFVIDRLLNWLPQEIENSDGQTVENPNYNSEYAAAIVEIWEFARHSKIV